MQEDWRKRAISWLGKNNADQQNWAIKYLGKKSWFSRDRRSDEPAYDYLVTHIRNALDTPKHQEDLRQIKRAWSQKKKRDQKGQATSYSFMMSKAFGPRLRYLARKRGEPMYRALESIIFDHHEEVRSHAWLDMSKKRLENRMEEVDEKLKDLESSRQGLDLKEADVQSRLSELEDKVTGVQLLEDECLEQAVALDDMKDLILKLLDDYTDAIHAHVLNQWIIGRRASLPPVPMSYQGQSKAAHFLRPYHDLSASL